MSFVRLGRMITVLTLAGGMALTGCSKSSNRNTKAPRKTTASSSVTESDSSHSSEGDAEESLVNEQEAQLLKEFFRDEIAYQNSLTQLRDFRSGEVSYLEVLAMLHLYPWDQKHHVSHGFQILLEQSEILVSKSTRKTFDQLPKTQEDWDALSVTPSQLQKAVLKDFNPENLAEFYFDYLRTVNSIAKNYWHLSKTQSFEESLAPFKSMAGENIGSPGNILSRPFERIQQYRNSFRRLKEVTSAPETQNSIYDSIYSRISMLALNLALEKCLAELELLKESGAQEIAELKMQGSGEKLSGFWRFTKLIGSYFERENEPKCSQDTQAKIDSKIAEIRQIEEELAQLNSEIADE